MSGIAKIEPLLTVADLESLPDDSNRYELFEGELFVSRAPALTHQRVLINIIGLFLDYLKENPLGEVLANPGIVFDDLNSAVPDVVFMTNEQVNDLGEQERIQRSPALIIEIVSPGKENARRDRDVKRQVYGKHGATEYWIIDPETRSLEIYRREGSSLKLKATLRNDNSITSSLLPGFDCKANKFFG